MSIQADCDSWVADRHGPSKGEELVDHSKLPQAARDLIEAAEIEAQSIFDQCVKGSNYLLQQAHEAGFDPFDIGFSPGRPALEAARTLTQQCPFRAAGHLFHATALVYWQHVLRPDVTTFIALLGTIWEWAYGKFGLRFELPEEVKLNWKVWALKTRATTVVSKQGPQTDRGSETSSATPVVRRGYRAEVRQWMKQKHLRTVKQAADRLNVGYDILKSIMSSKGEKRYADGTLKRVLEQIRK